MALRLLDCGISVLPISTRGVQTIEGKERTFFKSPDLIDGAGWRRLEKVRFTREEAIAQFSRNVGIGIIAGAISGNLEIADIEKHAPLDELAALLEEHAPGLFARLPRVLTGSGGWHLFYRCSIIEGNQKLAMAKIDGLVKTIMETRGEGGYVVTISSPATCHDLGGTYQLINGRLSDIPTITPEEREILLTCCRSFNTYVKPANTMSVQRSFPAGDVVGRRPGDDYNKRGNPLEILLKHQWTISHKSGDTIYLSRPGKKSGVSATFGHIGPNALYVFSSNAAPFDFERGYDAFGIYTVLEHGGDTAPAAKALAAQGYGEKKRLPTALSSPVHATSPASNGNGDTSGRDLALRPVTDISSTPVVATLDNGQTLAAMAQLTNPTEDAVALLFEEAHKNQFRYCKAWGTWLYWDLSHWDMEKTGLALDEIRILSRMVNVEDNKSTAKASFSRGVEVFTQNSRTFATKPERWDQNDMFLNTPERTIDLYAGHSNAPRPEDYITKICRVSPSSVPRPIFDRFMRDICLEDEALIRYHQRALGSILSGAMSDHWIIFWIGAGRNGKNTLGDLVTWILGDYAKVIGSETLMSSMSGTKHPTDLASLRGVRLAVSSEVPEGAYWDDARIKTLTGDETISARFMRQDFFTFRRTHKHLIFGNHRPMLRVVDDAIKARLHIVPFNAKFTNDACDPEMPQKLRTEAPQILQWLLDGHEMWLEDGTLKRCSAVDAETDRYFQSQSTPDMWLAECCMTGPDQLHSQATATELYQSFSSWKESRGEKPMSQTRWGEWMSTRYDKRKSDGRMVYDSIRLDPNSMTDSSKQRSWNE